MHRQNSPESPNSPEFCRPRADGRCYAVRAFLVAFLLWPVAAHAAFQPKGYFLSNIICVAFPGVVSSSAEACSCGGLAGAVGLCDETVEIFSVVNRVAGNPASCNVSQDPDFFCRVTSTNKRTGTVSV